MPSIIQSIRRVSNGKPFYRQMEYEQIFNYTLVEMAFALENGMMHRN